MATSEERRALLATPCPHCGARAGERCIVPMRGMDTQRGRGNGRPITTLDGGSHSARWQAALGREPAVVGTRVAELHPPKPRPAPVAAAAERPW